MTEKPYIIVNNSTGFCANLTNWDGEADWTPPTGFTAYDISAVSPAPGIGWTRNSDGTYTAPSAPTPSIAEQYLAQLALGLVLTSTGTPALNATYDVAVPNGLQVNLVAQANVTAVETSIAAGRGLPGGGSTFNYYDQSNSPHAFNDTNWGNFVTAMRDYSYNLQNWALGGCSGSPPSNSVTIA